MRGRRNANRSSFTFFAAPQPAHTNREIDVLTTIVRGLNLRRADVRLPPGIVIILVALVRSFAKYYQNDYCF